MRNEKFVYIIFIILGVIGLGGLMYIISRKFLSLSLIDVEKSVSKAKQIKQAIIASRFHRLLNSKSKKPKEILRTASSRMKDYFDRTVDKLMEIEKKTAATAVPGAAKKMEKIKEKPPKAKTSKTEEKIAELLREAVSLAEGGSWKQAEGKYIEVLKVNPKNIAAYQGLGKLYFENDKNNEARQIFEFLLKLGAEDADLYINLANLSWEEDNLDEAKTYYLKALSLDGTKVAARVNLGLVFGELGDKDSAAQQFRAALELEPKNPRYLDLLIESSIKVGNKDLAKQALRNLKAVNPENKKIEEFKARIEEMS